MTPSTHPPSPFELNSGNPQNVQNGELDKNPASQLSASGIYDNLNNDAWAFNARRDAHELVGNQPARRQPLADNIYNSILDAQAFNARRNAHELVGQLGVQQSTAPRQTTAPRQATAPKIPSTQL